MICDNCTNQSRDMFILAYDPETRMFEQITR